MHQVDHLNAIRCHKFRILKFNTILIFSIALQQPDDLSQHERARRSPQFSIKTKSRLGLGLGAFFDKHRETQSSIGDLATANKKAGLLEKTSQLSTREQKNTAVRKLGDQESHSVSSVKTLDEKHSTAMAIQK